MRAKLPTSDGFVARDGVRIHYEVYGDGPQAMVFIPPWSIVHSRVYKAQIPYFSERFRCIAYDGRGNGLSDRPDDVAAYSLDHYLGDALAVMDATAAGEAILVGLSYGGMIACCLAALVCLAGPARPADPMLCLRPAAITAAARRFVDCFPGDVLYAVKCNPEPRVLRALWAGGVRHFDCASLAEVKLVRKLLPAAGIHFMHPVKTRPAIREAFHRYGVTDFALDSADELAKILQETVPVGLVGDPPILGLFLRLALPKGGAVYDLSGKFGAQLEDAIELLRAARPHAVRLGIAFHVGSQCLEPNAYARAMALAGEAIANSGVAVDIVDVGGGFPVSYPDMTPPALADYVAAIRAGAVAVPTGVRLWAEPGRALCPKPADPRVGSGICRHLSARPQAAAGRGEAQPSAFGRHARSSLPRRPRRFLSR